MDEEEQAIDEPSTSSGEYHMERKIQILQVGHTPANSFDSRALKEGEMFETYDEFKRRLEEHKEVTSTDYWVRDCRTLAKAASNVPRSLKAAPELRYYYIKLNCKYGGQTFKSKSTNKRKFSGTFRQGCAAKILVSLSDCSQYLVVKYVNNNHNHVCNKDLLKIRPGSVAKVRRSQQDDKNDGLERFNKQVVHHGYTYRTVKSNRHEKKLYLICTIGACPGRAYRILGEDVTVTKAHTHEADEFILERLQFQEKLKTRAQKEIVPVKLIYEQESENFPTVCETFDSFKQMMIDARKKFVPEIPKSLQELGYLLVSEDWYSRYGCNLEDPPRDLFMGAVRGKGKETSAVFASLFFCDLMNKKIDEIHIDASYMNVPSKPFDIKHLLSIHMVDRDCSFGAVYALMSSRNLSAILSVLKFVKDEVLTDCVPTTVYTSFEAEMQIACREVFNTSQVEGTCYHFMKDVWSHCISLNIIASTKEDAVKMELIKACLALHHLSPSLMESGVNAISSAVMRSDVNSTAFITLIQHIKYSWLEAVGAAEISSNENPRRSNPNIQNFHQEFDFLASKREYTIWRFISILQELDKSHRQEYENLERGENLKPLRRCELTAKDPKVLEASVEMAEGNIGILEFLNIAGSTVERITTPNITLATVASLSDEEMLEEDDSDLE